MNIFKKGSKGESKAPIIVFVIVLAIVAFISIKFVIVYNQKWNLESKMEELMQRFYHVGEEGIFFELNEFVEKEGVYGFDAYDACTFVGELEEAGTFDCTYTKQVVFPGYTHTLHMNAHAETSRIRSNLSLNILLHLQNQLS